MSVTGSAMTHVIEFYVLIRGKVARQFATVRKEGGGGLSIERSDAYPEIALRSSAVCPIQALIGSPRTRR